MNFEGGYFITDNIGVGLFLAYSTNNEYFGQRTLNISETAAMTTDQQHSLFQLPFGASFRYRFVPESQFIPYLSLKLGPEYSEMSSYYNVYKSHDYDWGFYISPEVGITMGLLFRSINVFRTFERCSIRLIKDHLFRLLIRLTS